MAFRTAVILIAIFAASFLLFFNPRIVKITNNSNGSESNQNIFNLSDLPRIVHHNFIELDKIAGVSRFRSGYGHDFSRGINETNSCRSMKHYFMIKGINDSFWSRYHEGKVRREEWPLVRYFAPVNGTIIDMRPARNIFNETEYQFILQDDDYPAVWFLFFHVITNISNGSHVFAGELLGTVSPGNDGEIGVSINSNTPEEQLISIFQIMDDATFSEFRKRGAANRSIFIIPSAERNKNPLICQPDGERRFIGSWEIPDNKSAYDSWSMSSANWVFLN